MSIFEVTLGSFTELSTRHFTVREGESSLFTISLWGRTPNPSVDLAAIIGQPASFRIQNGLAYALRGSRAWTGICSYVEQRRVEPSAGGLSTYQVTIVPTLWRLTQRRGHRIYQHVSIPDIVASLLAEWKIQPIWRADRARWPRLEYKVQYGESDYAFFCRLLEEAGISFHFADETGESQLVLTDVPQSADPRARPLPFVDNPNEAAEREFITEVRLSRDVRPGAYTFRDYDFRKPAFEHITEAPRAPRPEDRYEQYHYRPGVSLFDEGSSGSTPAADDLGVARYDLGYMHVRASRALAATRVGREAVAFQSNAIDIHPGTVLKVEGHPHDDMKRELLVTELCLDGGPGEEWHTSGRAVFADVEYRPPLVTRKPVVRSVQCATVAGPVGQEIHTDEFGRVRVQFPWDREGKGDEHSSCWIRVSQGWAGRGYGMMLLPRSGQEVLIAFLDGDPDQPIIVGRVFNATEPVPYKLPENKTVSTWKSDSSPGSGGFNELKLDDKKGEELVYQQAERNQRALVKEDETITVLQNRQKSVGADETDTTGADRTEVTGADRSEVTGANRVIQVGADRAKLVRGNEVARTEGSRQLLVNRDLDTVSRQTKREAVIADLHLEVKGDLRELVRGTQSLIVKGDRHEKVEGRYALSAGKEIHLRTAEAMTQEASDVTLEGAGGFVRIDAGGVTIQGTHVYLNAGGGKPGDGRGSKPEKPSVPNPDEAK